MGAGRTIKCVGGKKHGLACNLPGVAAVGGWRCHPRGELGAAGGQIERSVWAESARWQAGVVAGLGRCAPVTASREDCERSWRGEVLIEANRSSL